MKRLRLQRVVPRTLFGRLVIILAVGMFAGQLLTSTIWFDTHDEQSLDIPVRLFASRVADTLRLLNDTRDEAVRAAVLRSLTDPGYQVQWIDAPALSRPGTAVHRVIEDRFRSVIRQRSGLAVHAQLVDARLLEEHRGHQGLWALLGSRMPSGEFEAQIQLPDGRWLDIRAREGQAGILSEPRSLIFDYLLRIYLIRFASVFILALIAVRIALQPLKRLAQAAESLGRNLQRPPLAVVGPAEVRSAAQSLNAMQQQLIDNIATRTRLLAAISHDLRTPITRLRLRAEMLTDLEARERFRSDLSEMETMVRATLDFMQGIEMTEPRRPVAIDSLLLALQADFAELGADVRIGGMACAPYEGDPRNLKRCLQNLLENAIRYGQRATVKAVDGPHDIRITISDEGPGIEREDLLERVFEPYFRIPQSSSLEHAGSGLGLSIARSIAVAHGGSLVLRNRRHNRGHNSGLDAILTLPRHPD